MPPDIIASYTKDLTIEPFGTKELIETFNFLPVRVDCFVRMSFW